mmetsp:Transcript_9464/g.25675  ORF Transcript_9464/g.25675 Transcript_9464/m.25675 type:complete len:252 (+) Transcript_9464:271-1026(+)
MEGIVRQRPIDHTARVPHLIALLQEAEVVHILHIWVDGVDLLVLRQLVHHAHQHEDLVALTTAVEETLTATEPQGHMLAVPGAATAAHDALSVDGWDEHRILDGAERPDERRGLQILVELDDAQDVLRRLVHDGQAHIAAKLLVGFLGQVLRVHDGALGTDAPIPVRVNEAQGVGVAGHQGLHVLRHGLGVQLEILRQHTPPMAVATAGFKLARGNGREGLPHLLRASDCLERAPCNAPRKPEHDCNTNTS